MKNMNRKYDKEKILPFWVGLMEGDGSFQVSPWRERSLQFRLIIKLKYTEANEHMLIEIAKCVGGSCRRRKKSKKELEDLTLETGDPTKAAGNPSEDTSQVAEVLWVMNDREKIRETLKIFDKFPPLTSKAVCGIAFMKTFLEEPNVDKYLETRGLKYEKQAEMNATALKQKFIYPSYWGPWLAGFTEAVGCFSIRQNGAHSYSIAQKDDAAIITAIKEYFNIKAAARCLDSMWSVSTAETEALKRIVDFFHMNPLLGEKAVSFLKFKECKGL